MWGLYDAERYPQPHPPLCPGAAGATVDHSYKGEGSCFLLTN